MSKINLPASLPPNRKSQWVFYRYDISDTWDICASPGCYVIYLDDKVGYIGQSTDVRKRIQNHGIRYGYSNHLITPWGKFLSVSAKVRYGVKLGDWAMREVRLISRLQPRFNCAGSTKKRAGKI